MQSTVALLTTSVILMTLSDYPDTRSHILRCLCYIGTAVSIKIPAILKGKSKRPITYTQEM